MKKVLIIGCLLLLTGCGEKINTCSIKTLESEQKWRYVSKEEKIKEIEVDIIFNNSTFGNIDSFNSLNSAQKETLKKQILKELGFEKSSYEGLEIKITVEKEIKVKVNIDYTKVNKELLNKIGIDFEDIDMNINQVITNMKSNGATCK